MQALEEENPADNINGEVEERVRSDSAASGNHDNDAFDEILSQGWDEQDAFKRILFQNFNRFGRLRLSKGAMLLIIYLFETLALMMLFPWWF